MMAEMPDELLSVDDQVASFKRAIEAVVLVATDPVAPELLAQLLEQPVVSVEQWCEELRAEYAAQQRGFELARIAGGYRYQTHHDQTPYVERFVLHDQKARLSGAALETLAIIAYKQPISRAQVASIRGVDPDGVIRTLQARGYIDEVGRDDGPGQAMLFGTTQQFLEKLGLDSIDDLPPIAEFIPSADIVEQLEHGLRARPSEADLAGPIDDDPGAGTHGVGDSGDARAIDVSEPGDGDGAT
jgi:segregation and condensation protein B